MKYLSLITNIVRLANAAFEVVLIRILYNEYTMADYFRKKGAHIGAGCEIHIRAIPEPFLVTIGNHVLIAPGALLHTHEGGGWLACEEDPDLWVFGKIEIEDNCLIGVNAQILPNVKIGKNSIVGAGSVVISNVPPDSVVLGVPARVVGSSAKLKEKYKAIWEKQKPPGWPYKHRKKSLEALKKHWQENLDTK
jgi:acetyltransferase-like isoleucine patch superfamily enzyme